MRGRTRFAVVAGGAAVAVVGSALARRRIARRGAGTAAPAVPRSLEDDAVFTAFAPGGRYGFWCNGPIGWVTSKVMPIVEPSIYKEVARMLELQPDDELLDIGCGPGAFLATQAKQVHRVVGLDLSPVMLREAERRLADRIAGGTARLVNANAAALPFDDAEFSAASAIFAVARPSEVFRVLRPGGRFVFADPSPRTSASEPSTSAGYPRWGEDDYRRMFEDAGFTDLTSRSMASPMGGDCLLVSCRKPAGSLRGEAVTVDERAPVISVANV